MFVFIILLCPAVFLLVSANPLLQALAQQACPVRNCQPDFRNVPVCHQPPSNINPVVQNQLPYPCNQNQPNQFNQVILNKLLGNPTLRTILDPNTKLFNQNGVEVPRQVPNNNCNPGCTGTVPNVINNYIIVPPELLLNELEREESRDERRNHNNGRDRTGSRRNKADRRRQQDGDTRTEDKTQRSQNQRETRRNRQRLPERGRNEYERDISDDDYLEHDREKPKSRRRQPERRKEERRVRDRPRQHERSEDHADCMHEENERIVKENRTAQVTYSINGTNVDNTTKNETGKIGERVSNNEVKQSAQDRVSSDQIILKSRTKPKVKVQKEIPSTTRENVENIRVVLPNESGNVQMDLQPNIKSCPRYSKEEAVIQDFRRKFPAIPENVVRNLLFHMKRQLQNQQLGSNTYLASFPISYDELYKTQSPNLRPSDINNNRNKNRQRSGKNRSRKRKQKNKQEKNFGCETTVELAPTIYVEDTEEIKPYTEKTTVQTTEQSSVKVTTVPVSTESSTVETEKSIDYTTIAKNAIETTTQLILAKKQKQSENVDDLYDRTAVPELGSEDIVPTIYLNGIIDDYYPDFTADNHAYAFSHEEVEVKHVLDDKYHYTTDKNIEMGELSRERRKYETESKNLRFHLWKQDRNINSDKQNEQIDLKSLSSEIEATLPKPTSAEDENEKIQFRSPPFLEEPDFETKPISKVLFSTEEPYYYHGYDPKDKYTGVTDKASVYSKAKTPKFAIKEKIKSKDDIETVYARSKVVKFGKPTQKSEEIISADITKDFSFKGDNSNENMFSVDGGTTFIIAKSYPDTN